MADYYTDNVVSSPTLGNQGPATLFSELAIVEDVYTLLGTETATQTVQIGQKIPEGWVPIKEMSYVVCEDPGTTLTLDIGWAGNPDGLCDGLDVSAGGSFDLESATGVYGLDPVASAGEALLCTFATVSTLTADAQIRFKIAFRNLKG